MRDIKTFKTNALFLSNHYGKIKNVNKYFIFEHINHNSIYIFNNYVLSKIQCCISLVMFYSKAQSK